MILHLVDARLGTTEADAAIASELRRAPRQGRPRGQQAGQPRRRHRALQLLLSRRGGAARRSRRCTASGSGDLLDAVVSLLPETELDEEDGLPRLAIVGRPNVGKSTLLNRLLGADRAVVSEVAGTTTDAVAGEVEVEVERRDRSVISCWTLQG